MFIVEHLITSFIASAAFGIIFNVPKKALLKCGFVGMVGWFIYIALVSYFSIDMILATLVAAFFIAIISQIFAKFYKTPMIVFNVSGIIPLVPGGMAYDAMRHIVENDYNMAVQLATKAFMLSGSIAIGLVFSEVINQMIKRSKI
ncbi:threonine/serine exporter family protein [Schinkia azotoformans]|uniref:Threonine/Serine exporter ThrE domain-containing protein n=1 Tax=Schinkia azotoformans LMG 9581 TaxID=1131731 RepID=K6CS06_SCHAZ|nr:threonine/serine exporter family protein [Schinkia azotoformans]EKN63007.1 hypothetical protein BAZO_19643 [Schinkia azotoformans LMG 9581]MEC1639297.1 threonine/serine exporter family protein [Schinkia azotoformans]MEC1719475.1 threonine/serine exporter family protein [Schinkia azotoformans]MEC1945884.1 threonine/serine exporter family protein [Schinkia azotoformans]MED4351235.1 threonine/serine exporter family protein [Schinkia azotoformans]